MKADRFRSHTGFSLLEAMVATAILATVLLGLAQLLAMTVTATGVASRETYATTLAARRLESLHAMTWEAFERTPALVTEFVDRTGTSGGGAPGSAVYLRQSTVAALGAAPSDTRVIEVRVRAGLVDRRLVSVRIRVSP